MTVTFFSFEIPKLNVMASPYMIIYNFFLVKIQAVPFIFAHFFCYEELSTL